MPVPYAFGAATSAIPLSQLDANFNTTITLGNTAIQLGNTVTTLNNMTLANVTISSGNVTITNVTVTTANATTVNTTTLIATTGNVTTVNATDVNVATSVTLNAGTANGVAYLNGSKVLTTGSALTFDGTKFQVAGSDIRIVQASNSANNGLYFRNFADNNTFAKVAYDAATGNLQVGTTQAYDTIFLQNNSEQMRLTSTGLGIGTSSPTQPLSIRNAGAAYLDVAGGNRTLGTNSFTFGQASDGVVAFFQRENAAMYWATNSTERMRIDASGNLGIGTSSPASPLQINSATAPTSGSILRIDNTATTTYSAGGYVGGQIRINFTNATGRYAGINFSNTGATSQEFFGAVQNSSGYNDFVWQGFNGGYGERMRLDSSGNLGLGVTPSAWDSSWKALQIGSLSAFANNGTGNTTDIWHNTYVSSSATPRYLTTAAASFYRLDGGSFKWFNAPSGTAGNAISFTQALTLDASGNLLLGGTSAGASSAASLAIFNGTAPTGSVTNGIILYAEDVSSSSELKVRDEAGNVTTLSPHNFSLIPDGPSEDMAWSYYSEKGGKRINVDMLKLARMVEKLTGEKLVYES